MDPCDEPVSIAPSVLDAQEYTITDTAKTYTIPVFISDPAWCAITYTYTVTDVSGSPAVSFNDDAMVRQFTFDYASDLLLCGATNTDYQISVTGTSGNVVPVSNSAQLILTLKNPCIDSNFVSFAS